MRYFSQAFARGVVLAVFFLVPALVSAATLYVLPETDTYSVGKSFSVRIRVSTDEAINAVSGALTFPTDKLQVTSVSKTGSTLTLWVQDPAFNNNTGRVTFEGVVPNPGYIGTNGLILVVTFRVVDTGTATVNLTNASVLANDGQGTNVLETLLPGIYKLDEAVVVPPAPDTSPSQTKPNDSPVSGRSLIVETIDEFGTDINSEEGKRVSRNINWQGLYESTTVSVLKFLIPTLLFIVLIYMSHLQMHRKRVTGSKFRSEIHDIEELLSKSFMLLREDVEDSVKLLEKARARRKLTGEEDAIMDRLKDNLSEAEKIISGRVRKIEKEMD